MDLNRPRPPDELIGTEGTLAARPFRPAPEVEAWMRAVFIEDDGPLANEDHRHLQSASIGVLWCAIPNARQMNRVVGQAEMPMFRGGAWSKARQEQQLEEWFGEVPDFLLTFDAAYADEVDDTTFCSLVEHELYHCGQQRDEYGAPKFTQAGSPKLGIRGHDVEEFVGVVARYGVGAAAGRTSDLVAAANARPTISAATITGACGTCGRPAP